MGPGRTKNVIERVARRVSERFKAYERTSIDLNTHHQDGDGKRNDGLHPSQDGAHRKRHDRVVGWNGSRWQVPRRRCLDGRGGGYVSSSSSSCETEDNLSDIERLQGRRPPTQRKGSARHRASVRRARRDPYPAVHTPKLRMHHQFTSGEAVRRSTRRSLFEIFLSLSHLDLTPSRTYAVFE